MLSCIPAMNNCNLKYKRQHHLYLHKKLKYFQKNKQTNKKKYLGINLRKYREDLHAGNYKMLIEIQHDKLNG